MTIIQCSFLEQPYSSESIEFIIIPKEELNIRWNRLSRDLEDGFYSFINQQLAVFNVTMNGLTQQTAYHIRYDSPTMEPSKGAFYLHLIKNDRPFYRLSRPFDLSQQGFYDLLMTLKVILQIETVLASQPQPFEFAPNLFALFPQDSDLVLELLMVRGAYDIFKTQMLHPSTFEWMKLFSQHFPS